MLKEKINIYEEQLTEKIEDGYIAKQERIKGNIVGNQMCLEKLGYIEDLERQIQAYREFNVIAMLEYLRKDFT